MQLQLISLPVCRTGVKAMSWMMRLVLAMYVAIFEMFYTIHDLQHINNPGYNRDRGSVVVPAVRLHLDL